MRRLKSNCLPENIRKRLAPETRKELRAPTSAESQAKLDTRREKELQENIANLLRQRGIWFFRQRMDRRTTGTVGAPDFLLAVGGRAVGIEAKRPGFSPTEHQDHCHADMRANGWKVYVVINEQQVVEILNNLGA